jgi:hypothetical protein
MTSSWQLIKVWSSRAALPSLLKCPCLFPHTERYSPPQNNSNRGEIMIWNYRGPKSLLNSSSRRFYSSTTESSGAYRDELNLPYLSETHFSARSEKKRIIVLYFILLNPAAKRFQVIYMLHLVIKVDDEGHKAAFFPQTLKNENIKHRKQKSWDMTLLIECHGSFVLLTFNVTLTSSGSGVSHSASC